MAGQTNPQWIIRSAKTTEATTATTAIMTAIRAAAKSTTAVSAKPTAERRGKKMEKNCETRLSNPVVTMSSASEGDAYAAVTNIPDDYHSSDLR